MNWICIIQQSNGAVCRICFPLNSSKIPPKTSAVSLDKRKEDGQGLAEAKLQLLKGDGSLIQQWISNGSARLFEAEAGSYILGKKKKHLRDMKRQMIFILR